METTSESRVAAALASPASSPPSGGPALPCEPPPEQAAASAMARAPGTRRSATRAIGPWRPSSPREGSRTPVHRHRDGLCGDLRRARAGGPTGPAPHRHDEGVLVEGHAVEEVAQRAREELEAPVVLALRSLADGVEAGAHRRGRRPRRPRGAAICSGPENTEPPASTSTARTGTPRAPARRPPPARTRRSRASTSSGDRPRRHGADPGVQAEATLGRGGHGVSAAGCSEAAPALGPGAPAGDIGHHAPRVLLHQRREALVRLVQLEQEGVRQLLALVDGRVELVEHLGHLRRDAVRHWPLEVAVLRLRHRHRLLRVALPQPRDGVADDALWIAQQAVVRLQVHRVAADRHVAHQREVLRPPLERRRHPLRRRRVVAPRPRAVRVLHRVQPQERRLVLPPLTRASTRRRAR